MKINSIDDFDNGAVRKVLKPKRKHKNEQCEISNGKEDFKNPPSHGNETISPVSKEVKKDQQQHDESTKQDGNIEKSNESENKSEEPFIPKKKRKKINKHLKQSKDEEEFTVLKNVPHSQLKPVEWILPRWLREPLIITPGNQPLNEYTHLAPRLVTKLISLGITSLFPVQKHVIAHIIEQHRQSVIFPPSDLCVSAPTGSGKTLAYVLPLLHCLLTDASLASRTTKALVVVPSRELANQVYSVFKNFVGKNTLKVALVTSTETFAEEQNNLVAKDYTGHISADIVIATPGRLIDHLKKTEGFTLKHLRFLILDEADRMMNDVKNGWLADLEKSISESSQPKNVNECKIALWFKDGIDHKPYQKLLFSATLSHDPENLERFTLFRPQLFTFVSNEVKVSAKENELLGKYTTPEGLKEFYVCSCIEDKPLVIYSLIKSGGYKGVLCFAESVQDSHRLKIILEAMGDIGKVEEFSSALSQKQRLDTFARFSKGSINVLVASDSLARGIDVANVQCVILYAPPFYIKNYIHRVGRTARAGHSGTAITLVTSPQLKGFLSMTRKAGKHLEELKISKSDLDTHRSCYDNARSFLSQQLLKEKKNAYKRKSINSKSKI